MIYPYPSKLKMNKLALIQFVVFLSGSAVLVVAHHDKHLSSDRTLEMQQYTGCPIMGQVFQQCRTCPATCTNPDLQCTHQCKGGCGCPFGQLIDTVGNRCVNPQNCPKYNNMLKMQTTCPILGQVFQQCRTCPATCTNPDLMCTLQCIEGCGCPFGQLIDTVGNKCVNPKNCPKSLSGKNMLEMQQYTGCPIMGQVFQQCRTCPATCTNPDLQCTHQCKEGCGCPFGQLIDTVGNRCVYPQNCPKSPGLAY